MTAAEWLLKAAIRKGNVDSLGLYFTAHLAEETGHIKMLEDDLDSLGVKVILNFPAAAQLAGAQYYYIEHDHPAMLLGYMLALESNAPTIEKIEALEVKYGPLKCMRHHALHDPGHAKELQAQIVNLDPYLRGRVIDNLNFTLSELRHRVAPLIEQASKYFTVN